MNKTSIYTRFLTLFLIVNFTPIVYWFYRYTYLHQLETYGNPIIDNLLKVLIVLLFSSVPIVVCVSFFLFVFLNYSQLKLFDKQFKQTIFALIFVLLIYVFFYNYYAVFCIYFLFFLPLFYFYYWLIFKFLSSKFTNDKEYLSYIFLSSNLLGRVYLIIIFLFILFFWWGLGFML